MKPTSFCATIHACVLALCVSFPVIVRAHCDTMDGPVVADVRAALASSNVTSVLKWIKPEHEPAVRPAFDRTMAVRTNGVAARELADQFLFETVVRLHREGEGAPYTGLKPAGTDPGAAVRLADDALEKNKLQPLAKLIQAETTAGLERRFTEVMDKKRHAAHSVEAGREYVAAYVEFVHYAEGLHDAAARPAAHAPAADSHPQPEAKHVH